MGFPEAFKINLNENREANFQRWLQDYRQELFVYKSHGFEVEEFDMAEAERKFDRQYGFEFYDATHYIS